MLALFIVLALLGAIVASSVRGVAPATRRTIFAVILILVVVGFLIAHVASGSG
jgi:hypothetical protein